jgi:monomeric isocitrate dehydrogenase
MKNEYSSYHKTSLVALNRLFCIAHVSGSVLLNKHGLKSGDIYRTNSFIGDIVVTAVFESYFKVKMEHVSGEDYLTSCSLSEFNNKMIIGEITSLIRP